MKKNTALTNILAVALVLALMASAVPVGADDGLRSGYSKVKDWDKVHEAFSFAHAIADSSLYGGATTSGGDFFMAPRGIHVFDSPGIIDMGEIYLDAIGEAPASGYVDMATPINGHSYVVRSKGKYGKFYLEEAYDWLDPIEYGISWVYQTNGTRTFEGTATPSEPATPGPGTGGEYGCTYEQYVAAYNKLTSLMAEGKGDTPQAQQAYEEYVVAKACYESTLSGTELPPSEPATPGPGTGGEYECPQDLKEAYQQYIAAYNKLLYLMDKGEEDSPQALAAYDDYAVKKACWEARDAGTEPPATPTPEQPVFGSSEILKKGFKGNVYYLEEGTDRLPDFSRMTPVGTIYTEKLDIPSRSFTEGFPGVTDRFEWFGISYIGGIVAPTEGDYTFKLISDDGAKLYIDGELVIDNDGIHPPSTKTKRVHLARGDHVIKVDYFQGPRHSIALQLLVQSPGGVEAPVEPGLDPSKIVPPMPESTPTPGAGLVLHLPFDGSYSDASGYGNHGTPKGSMRFTPGVVGQQAAYFDGKSYVEIRDSNSLDLSTAFTFSVWLNKEDAGAGGWAVVLSKGDTAAADDNSPYALLHNTSGLSPMVRLIKDNRLTYVTSAGERTDFKQWHHLGVTWDGRDVKFYVDGVLTDTQTWQGPLPNSASSLLIGCDPPGATEYFRGMMDDLRIYNYALSGSQVQGVYSGAGHAPPPPPTGMALIVESRTVPPGGTVQVPVRLENAQNVGSIGFQLSYDPAVAQVTQVLKGSLPPTFTSNTQQPGRIIIGFATTEGVSGQKGSAVYVEFKAVGAQGSTCALTLSQIEATDTSGATVPITPVNGALTIGKGTVGDGNGDGKINVLDALMALKMYVKLLGEDLKLDMNQDGRVSPEDARLILEIAKPG